MRPQYRTLYIHIEIGYLNISAQGKAHGKYIHLLCIHTEKPPNKFKCGIKFGSNK